MSRRPAPSLPTPDQIRKAFEAVAALSPGARIARVGPEGVTFEYPDASKGDGNVWAGKPFSDRP